MSTQSWVNPAALEAAQHELEAVDREMRPLLERRQRIEKQISLARELMDLQSGGSPNDTCGHADASSNEADHQPPGPTLVDAVPMVLAKHGPLRPAEIKTRLSSVGFNQQHNDNYFYTVISRLTKSGTIVRRDDKRLSMPNGQTASSPNGAMH